MSNPAAKPRLAHDENAFLSKFPCRLIPTNLKGAYAVAAPPDDFDPDTATEEELIRHGILWRRPSPAEHPALAKAWQRLFSRECLAKNRIVPQLETQPGNTHNLKRKLTRVSNQDFTGFNWAGAGIRGGGPWDSVTGTWTIPAVSQAPEPPVKDGIWNSSSWVGIDGFDEPGSFYSNDVLQAGVQQEVIYHARRGGRGYFDHKYVAWFEWTAPAQPGSPDYIYQVNITNVPVSPGQQVSCLVQYLSSPNFDFGTLGSIYFVNETTGDNVSMVLLAPPGATAEANTVEWIMEAPNHGEGINSLAKFTPVVFTSAVASGAAGVGNPQNGDITNIETYYGLLQILTSVTVGNETVTIDFIG